MKHNRKILVLAMLCTSAFSLAVEVPSGRLTTSGLNNCDASTCEPCYFIAPSLDHACSDDFGPVDFTDFRTSLGLADFNEECTRHDSCYQVIGNTKAQCDTDFHDKLFDACEDTYISSIPTDIRNLINSAGSVRSAAEVIVLSSYNDLLSSASGISTGSYTASGFSIGNPFDGTPLDEPLDDIGDSVDDAADIVTNPLDGTILDDEKFDQLGDELANLEDSILDLINGLNLAKYYMCIATADIMVAAVAAGPGSLAGFDAYQKSAINLTTKQQNDYNCPIEDVQIVDTDNRGYAGSIISGLFAAYNLNASTTQVERYLSVWDVYGKTAFSQASQSANETHTAVIMIPVLSVLSD